MQPSQGPSGSPSNVPSQLLSSRQCTDVAREDFEGISSGSAGWTGASVYTGNATKNFTQFLGPFGQDQEPIKTFMLPNINNNVRVQFHFYQIDSWDESRGRLGPDSFKVFVDDQMVDLGIFSQTDIAGGSGTTSAGIRWSHFYLDAGVALADRGFGQWVDMRHKVSLEIPSSFLSSESLVLRFFADLKETGCNNNNPCDEEWAGIDNLNITSCPEGMPFPTV